MQVTIESTWKEHLEEEFQKPYFSDLIGFVKSEYATKTCYPPEENIFSAFDSCPWEDLKVVLIGQDPYHGPGQANGLCFSVKPGITFPPSLLNIFKEIHKDLDQPIPKDGDLFRWSKQGVLLLNSTLTVREGQAGSHQGKGWETFTDAVIKMISDEKKNMVFLLWGGYSKKKTKLIDGNKHLILESGHPSPLSANRGYWFGNKHFSKCNGYLKSKGLEEIDW